MTVMFVNLLNSAYTVSRLYSSRIPQTLKAPSLGAKLTSVLDDFESPCLRKNLGQHHREMVSPEYNVTG
jgi:hypothetical protein